MSEKQEKQKVVQITGNNYIHMENLKEVGGELVYTIRNGALVMQLNKESAELIYTTLKEWLKQEDDEENKLRIFKNKANANSTKQHPIRA